MRLALGLLGVLLVVGMAAARVVDRNWLPPDADLGAALRAEPRRVSASEQAGGHSNFLIDLGELAFNAPTLLGVRAGQAGISCRSCHPNGDRNALFFLPGASRHPGSFDGTTSLFTVKREDGIDNPLEIPSLRGVRLTAPYGRDGRFASLREFVRQVIVEEFDGREPPARLLDGLIAYLNDLDFLPNPLLGPGNRLVATAPEAAKRGEAAFAPACGQCHIPSAQFVDRRAHDIGTGGSFDTPSLRGVALRQRLLHDGRADGLAAAVAQHGIALEPAVQRDILAYLAAIGDGETPQQSVAIGGRLAQLGRALGLIERSLAEEDADLTGFIADSARGEIGRIDERLPAAHPVFVFWAGALATLAQQADNRDFPAATRTLDTLRRQIAADRGRLDPASLDSLFGQ